MILENISQCLETKLYSKIKKSSKVRWAHTSPHTSAVKVKVHFAKKISTPHHAFLTNSKYSFRVVFFLQKPWQPINAHQLNSFLFYFFPFFFFFLFRWGERSVASDSIIFKSIIMLKSKIKTHKIGNKYQQERFFILSKGNNAGKPLPEYCANCFVFLADDVEEKEFICSYFTDYGRVVYQTIYYRFRNSIYSNRRFD